MIQFWLGDLNYRVDATDEALKRWVKAKEWGWVLEKDQVSPAMNYNKDSADTGQLKSDITSEKSFGGFQEGEINFPP
jgi:hypothetical protein